VPFEAFSKFYLNKKSISSCRNRSSL